jgi:hypothetical protein
MSSFKSLPRRRATRVAVAIGAAVAGALTTSACTDTQEGQGLPDPLGTYARQAPAGESVYWLGQEHFHLSPFIGRIGLRGTDPKLDALRGVVVEQGYDGQAELFIVTYVQPKHPTPRLLLFGASVLPVQARRQYPNGQVVEIRGFAIRHPGLSKAILRQRLAHITELALADLRPYPRR